MAVNAPRRQRRPASQILAALGLIVSVAVAWTLSRPASEVERVRRHFVELQRQVQAAQATKAARQGDRARVMRLRAQARTANEGQQAALDAEATAIESRLGWGDRAAVRSAVGAAPLVTFARARVPPVTTPVFSTAANGCAACHVAVATAGFENYPAPFRTHPNLSLYVGAASPHQPSRVGCRSCHLGDGPATTFSEAGHSTLRAEARAARVGGRDWADPAAPGAMLPKGRIEAGCVGCHVGERYQPGASALNEAMVTLERGGCYGCHDVSGMERADKRGPDLRRIRGKLTPDWVRRWLLDPRAVKPATWMPRFWTGRDPLDDEARAEIDAAVAYLFANADDYRPALASPSVGDPARGQRLVESVGCLGCHVVGDAAREQTSLRRTFGQPLQAIGAKTTYAWLFDWVREPSRYSPDTRMPSLRLSDGEAADVATYLQTLAPGPPQPVTPPSADDEVYRAVARRYAAALPSSTDVMQLTGEALQVAAGRAVIGAIGCFNCHAIRGFEDRTTRTPFAPRSVWSDQDGAATHAMAGGDQARPSSRPGPAPLTADYAFGSNESARLALALTAVAGPVRTTYGIGMPWHVRKVAGRALVQERNCVGCHVIEGLGGDLVKLVAEPTLGPPLLTPEGSRVQPDWLRGFLHQPRVIRPWLSVRMPTFRLTDDEVERTVSYFGEIAPPNPEPAPAPSGATAAAGKELFDLLKCQQCHVLGAIPSDQPTSNLAPDLRMARGRLQPEWILAWLRNPSAILPGTRMPTFWPDYPKSFYQPLDRGGAAQVRAIRDHLLTLR